MIINLIIILIIIVISLIALVGILHFIITKSEDSGDKTRSFIKSLIPKLSCTWRRRLGLPILYTVLFGILMKIEWSARIIKNNHLLVGMAIIAMILPAILLEYRQSEAEKLKDQKRLNIHYTVLTLFIFSLVGGMELGWIKKVTHEDKKVEAVMKKQLDLALKPVEERLSALNTKAEKELLSPSEILELTKLKKQADGIRNVYGFGQRELDGTKTSDDIAPVRNNWQLCWEKVPGYNGETDARSKCLRAKIEKKDDDLIVISYASSYGRGIQKGTSSDGVSYSGEWKDSTGWGRWHLKFVSSDTAFGWSDDKGSGYKQPNVLERRS